MKNLALFITLFIFILSTSCEKEEPTPDTDSTTESLIDIRDGNEYKTVKIGDQIWMAENLRFDPDTFVRYDFPTEHGRNYIWMQACEACPEGWHLPSLDEWNTLFQYLGGDSIAGGKMKLADTTWLSPNTGATNLSEFAAHPEGYYNDNGILKNAGKGAYFWTSNENEEKYGDSWNVHLWYDVEKVEKMSAFKRKGFSVRCIKDD
jgi:uncharacterized protein (TIGR02145 family)